MQSFRLQEAFTVKEAAKAAGCHWMTVYKWIYRGILPARKSKNGRYRILPADLKDFIEPPDDADLAAGDS